MSTSVFSDPYLPHPLWPVKCYFRDALVPSTAPSTHPLLLSNLAQATARENHSLMRREGWEPAHPSLCFCCVILGAVPMRSRRHMVGSRHVLLMVLAPVLALVAGVVALPGGTNATNACVDTPLFVANATFVRTLVGNVSTRSGASASSAVPPDTLGCVPRILCGSVYACVSCAACSWGVVEVSALKPSFPPRCVSSWLMAMWRASRGCFQWAPVWAC